MLRYATGMIAVLLLAACGGGTGPGESQSTPTATPAVVETLGSSGERQDSAATGPEAPETWQEPSAVITRDNVNRSAYLGRLKPPGTPSTLFRHDFTPDGTQLIGVNNTQMVGWDLITGEQTFENTRQGAVQLFVSPNKREFYTVAGDGEGKVFGMESGARQYRFRAHPSFNNVATFHAESGLMAVAGTDGTVKVWDTLERRSLVTFDAHDGSILALAFSPDGEQLATAGEDELVHLWHWREREQTATIDNGAESINIAYAPDSSQVATAGQDFVTIWRPSDGEFQHTLQTGPGGAVDVLTYAPDGRYLVTGGTAPDMAVWDGDSGELLAVLPEIGGRRTSAAFSPDGDLLLASELDGPVTLWDMTRISEETVVRADLDVGSRRVVAVDFSPDGYTMLFVDAAGPVYVWGIPPEAAASETN